MLYIQIILLRCFFNSHLPYPIKAFLVQNRSICIQYFHIATGGPHIIKRSLLFTLPTPVWHIVIQPYPIFQHWFSHPTGCGASYSGWGVMDKMNNCTGTRNLDRMGLKHQWVEWHSRMNAYGIKILLLYKVCFTPWYSIQLSRSSLVRFLQQPFTHPPDHVC